MVLRFQRKRLLLQIPLWQLSLFAWKLYEMTYLISELSVLSKIWPANFLGKIYLKFPSQFNLISCYILEYVENGRRQVNWWLKFSFKDIGNYFFSNSTSFLLTRSGNLNLRWYRYTEAKNLLTFLPISDTFFLLE